MSEFNKRSLAFLRNEFGLTLQADPRGRSKEQLVPTSLKGSTIKLPSDLEKALEVWKNGTTVDSKSMHERFTMWKMLDQMAHNSGPVAKTVQLYKNETIGSKINAETIVAKARTRKQEKWIKKFLQDAGYTKSNLESIVGDLVIFGNALGINSIDPLYGITEVTPTDPFSLQERVEFNPVRIKHQVDNGFYGYDNLAKNDPRMVQFVKAVKDPNMATSEYFKSTLMGYKIDDFEFAPWQVAHFRMPSSRHEFAPYGRPLLLPALSPYMTWKATKDMIALARVASFPKEIITLKNAANLPPDMMFEKLQELKELEENLAPGSAQDTVGVGGKIYTIDSVWEYDLKATKMDLSAIGDLNAEEENVISALDVPIAYLIQGKDKGFGETNKALVAQSKIFAKAVYSIQSAILEVLITQVKTQMILTGDYDPEKDTFEISMPLPTVDDDPELIRLYQEKLRLAKDTAETIRDLLGIPMESQLPTETVESILAGLSAAPADELAMWVKTIAEDSILPLPLEDEEAKPPMTEAVKKKIKTKLTEDLVREAILVAKEASNLNEGTEHDRHFMSSCSTSQLDRRILEDIRFKLTRVRLEEENLKGKQTATKLKESKDTIKDIRHELFCASESLSAESKEKYMSSYKAKL